LGEHPEPRVARLAKLVSAQPEQERSVSARRARQVEQPMARQQQAERSWLLSPVLLAQKEAQSLDAAAQLRDAALPQESQPSVAQQLAGLP